MKSLEAYIWYTMHTNSSECPSGTVRLATHPRQSAVWVYIPCSYTKQRVHHRYKGCLQAYVRSTVVPDYSMGSIEKRQSQGLAWIYPYLEPCVPTVTSHILVTSEANDVSSKHSQSKPLYICQNGTCAPHAYRSRKEGESERNMMPFML